MAPEDAPPDSDAATGDPEVGAPTADDASGKPTTDAARTNAAPGKSGPTDAPNTDAPNTDATRTDAGERPDDQSGSGGGGRDVEVPMRVYKTVTVFSTLFAVAFVLGGFLLLDRATDRATASLSEVDPVLAVLGLLGIVAGAAVYAFGTRFRAEGMGTPKDRPDEPPDDE